MLHWSDFVVAPLSIVHYLVFVLSTIFLVFIYVKVYQRYKQRSKLAGAVLCAVNTLAVICILLLMLPIFQLKALTENAIVITDNSDEKLLEQAIERYQHSDMEHLFVLTSDINQRQMLTLLFNKNNLMHEVVWLSSGYQLFNQSHPDYHNIANLYIYGDGLTVDQIKYLDREFSNLNISYFSSNRLIGIVAPTWSNDVLLGASATFTGTLQSNEINTRYKIELSDINQDVMSSVDVRANERFHFDFIPKMLGVNTYHLNIIDTKTESIIVKERISLNVMAAGHDINVLVKTASPSFEIRHLKNWLAEQGSQLTVINKTSKNVSLTQLVNAEYDAVTDIENITNEYLSHFDILILDGRTIVGLSQAQQQLIVNAIEQGLALFVLVDNALINKQAQNKITELFQTFALLKNTVDASVNKSTAIYFNNTSNSHRLTPINISLDNKFGDKLVTTAEFKPLVISKSKGFGSVTLSTVNTSYQWKISGLTEHYGQYWQYLFGNIINKKNGTHWLSSPSNTLIWPLDKSSFCYHSADSEIVAKHKLINNIVLAQPTSEQLTVNKRIERQSQYCIDWIATQSGWHQFELQLTNTNNRATGNSGVVMGSSNETNKLVYVNEPEQWLAWQQTMKQKTTSQRALRDDLNTTDASQQNNQVHFARIPFGKWPVWLLFIACCSVLWIERKMA